MGSIFTCSNGICGCYLVGNFTFGNKVVNAMKKDDAKLDKDINKGKHKRKGECSTMSKKGLVLGVVVAVAVVGGVFTVKSVERIGTR